MTDGKSGKTANWLAAGSGVLLLVGAMGTGYSTLNSNINDVTVRTSLLKEGVERKLKELDNYDAKLSEDNDNLKDRMTRSEAEREAIRKTQDKIEFTMSEMLREIKRMNDNLIRMNTINAKSKEEPK